MSAALSHRRLLVGAGVVAYVSVFAAFVYLEEPGLGIGHLYYLPIALVALASGPLYGASAGLLATALWAAGVLLTPRIPVAEVLTVSTVIRGVTFTASGLLIGAFAATNRQLITRLSELAQRDFLTGVLNARAFEAELQRRCAGTRRFAVLLGDVDGLKLVNDTRGHAEGNRLLQSVARLIRETVRDHDVVARVGGDEFALLTDASTEAEAVALGRRLQDELDGEGLSMSIGWALYPEEAESSIALFRRADERLYASKTARRPRPEALALLRR